MSKLSLVKYPDPSLQKPSAKVVDFNAVKKLAADMIETMIKEKGIGLAAVQVGQSVQLAIINKDADKSLKDHLVIINPKIFSASKEFDIDEEGCLSVSGKTCLVPRHHKIKVRYTNLDGREEKIKAVGLFARVLQHEIDHLNGILIIDKDAQD